MRRPTVERLEDLADRFLDREYMHTTGSLAVLRITFTTWLLLGGAGRRFPSVSEIPQSMWDPPLGPLRLLPSVPPRWFLVVVSVWVTCSLILVLSGLWTSRASVSAGVGLLAIDSIQNSFGKIDHGLLLLSSFLILMSWSGWGGAASIDLRRGRSDVPRSWPIAVTLLMLSVMMMMAALPKATSEWFDTSFSALQVRQLVGATSFGADRYLAQWATGFDNALLWESFDWVTIAFEGAFVFVVWKRRHMQVLLAFAALFHVSVLLLLNIHFTGFLFVYAVAFDWSRVGRAVTRAIDDTAVGPHVLALVSIALAAWGRYGATSRLLLSDAVLMFAGVLGAVWVTRSVVGRYSISDHVAPTPPDSPA